MRPAAVCSMRDQFLRPAGAWAVVHAGAGCFPASVGRFFFYASAWEAYRSWGV